MIYFYGLGNNEDQYLQTKHNIGRILLENQASAAQVLWKSEKGCSSARIQLNKIDCVFLHSAQYMNTSGNELREWLLYYKIDFSDGVNQLIVLQDDSDQLEGNAKLSIGGGSAGHKGIDSIYQQSAAFGISKKQLLRLKIGIRPLQNRLKSETFVLTKISDRDQRWAKQLSEVVFSKKTLEWLQKGELQQAITAVNSLVLQ